MASIDFVPTILSDDDAPASSIESDSTDNDNNQKDTQWNFFTDSNDRAKAHESTALTHNNHHNKKSRIKKNNKQQQHAWDLSEAIDMATKLDPAVQTTVDDKIFRLKKRKAQAQIKDGDEDQDQDQMDEQREKKERLNSKDKKRAKRNKDTSNDAKETKKEVHHHKKNPKHSSSASSSSSSSASPSASSSMEPVLLKGKSKPRKNAEKDFQSMSTKRKSKKSFTELSLSKPLLQTLEFLHWKSPTPIQEAAIPSILLGRDVAAQAATGSGKTAAFLLPIIERISRVSPADRIRWKASRCLILLPTRELAVQCHAVVKTLVERIPGGISACVAVGGLSNKVQEAELRKRPDIIVATPGRLIDHLRNMPGFSLEDLEVLVLDEADRLLELGFKDEVEQIVQACSKQRQTLLFSATMSKEVEWLVKLSLRDPALISVDILFDTAAKLNQQFVRIRGRFENNRDAILLSLVSKPDSSRTIIFFAHKKTAHRFKIIFGLFGLSAAELHGNLTQIQRLQALQDFRDANVDFLLCTDVAARGLDITGVETVINYEMPTSLREYVHRVGRTARAGRNGRAITFVGDGSERKVLLEIYKRAKEATVSGTNINSSIDNLQIRKVAIASVDKWRAKIDALDLDIKQILKEEAEERELRLADMQATKANNLIEHHDEIRSRPARTWFKRHDVPGRVNKSDRNRSKNASQGQNQNSDKKKKNKTRGEKKQELREAARAQAKEKALKERKQQLAKQQIAKRSAKKQRGKDGKAKR